MVWIARNRGKTSYFIIGSVGSEATEPRPMQLFQKRALGRRIRIQETAEGDETRTTRTDTF